MNPRREREREVRESGEERRRKKKRLLQLSFLSGVWINYKDFVTER